MKSLSSLTMIISAALPLMVFSNGCRNFFMNHFHSDSPGKMADKIAAHFSDELKLDKAQKEKLDKIKDDIISKHKEMQKESEPLFEEIHKEITKDSIDKDKLVSLMNKMGANHQSMHPFIADKIIEFQGMLTKEQKEILAKKINEFKEMQD
jgi:periplasmic protein CpxP/Spy